MVFKYIFGLWMLVAAVGAWSQTPADAPEWKEEKVAPPAYSTEKLLLVEMPPYVTLTVGIDPATVTVGADGVVRYVVVMRNTTGSVSAAYEGILCTNGEVKTYARAGSAGGWVVADQPEWKPMTDNLPSRHAYAIAQQGACDGRGAAKREAIIRAIGQRRKAYE